jgi:hypothetical protein
MKFEIVGTNSSPDRHYTWPARIRLQPGEVLIRMAKRDLSHLTEHPDIVDWRYPYAGQFPDDNQTVLAALDSDEPLPVRAYRECGRWHDADSALEFLDDVYAWTEIPLPRRPYLCVDARGAYLSDAPLPPSADDDID